MATKVYTYDVTGIKLAKAYTPSGGMAPRSDYAAEWHYEVGTLEFLQFVGGRVIDVIGTAEYQYLLTDHQGNTRAVWKTDGTLDQTADYYPFGLLHTDPNAGGGSPQNQYLFQGQEHQPELGWVQFKWRNSNPAIGRFFNIDPLSEDYSYNSTYAFSENKLTAHVELEGLESAKATVLCYFNCVTSPAPPSVSADTRSVTEKERDAALQEVATETPGLNLLKLQVSATQPVLTGGGDFGYGAIRGVQEGLVQAPLLVFGEIGAARAAKYIDDVSFAVRQANFTGATSSSMFGGNALSTGMSLVANSGDEAARGVRTSFDDVAAHVKTNGGLPDNFITKAEARQLGWNPRQGNLQEVAPGKSIGGDVFGNREGLLPNAQGRTWFEADINYSGGRRGSERLLYSNDGLIYKTTDHYRTFIEITP